MKKRYLFGNWKMNLSGASATTQAEITLSALHQYSTPCLTVGIAPSFLEIPKIVELAKDSSLMVGAQNVHFQACGAFTGEISSEMLVAAGASFVIVGHSERRTYFGETNSSAAQRAVSAMKCGLMTIFCMGETLAEREENRTKDIITSQLKGVIDVVQNSELSTSALKKLILAYEPVWAIGSGKVASPEQVDETTSDIIKIWSHLFDNLKVDKPKEKDLIPAVIYGGSVDPNNAKDLLTISNLSGFLPGGASIHKEKFPKLIQICAESLGH
jgi:triosephosphate isomerase